MIPVTKEDYAKSKWRQSAYDWLMTKKQKVKAVKADKKKKSKAEDKLRKAL